MVFSSAGVIAVGIATVAASASATTVSGRHLLEMENRTTTTTGVRSSIEAISTVYSFCGVDLVGGDQFVARYPNPDLCVTNCLPQTGCNAATWTNFEGGTCYFKRLEGSYGSGTTFPPINVAPNTGAVSFIRDGDGVTMPYLDRNLRFDGVDMPGNDIANYQTSISPNCPKSCAVSNDCFAVTWTPFNGGTCWFKSKASPFVPSPGAISHIMSHQTNPSTCLKF